MSETKRSPFKHCLPDWSARLGIAARVPLVAAAVAAAPGLDAQAKKFADMASSDMVVINHEEQYSLWPASVAVPKGWKSVAEASAPSEAAVKLRELGGEKHYVVINHEEQYSVWTKGAELPSGWKDTGSTCQASACAETLQKAMTKD